MPRAGRRWLQCWHVWDYDADELCLIERTEVSLLTIGFAHCNDFEGAWATVQSIISHTQSLDEIEFVIVDNSPRKKSDDESRPDKRSPHSERLLRLASVIHSGGIKTQFVRFLESTGTSYPRREVFRRANTPFAMCIDPHIDIPTNRGGRGIDGLIDFLRDAGDTKDIYSGILLHDSHAFPLGDSFDPTWGEVVGGVGAQMLGKWSIAWTHPEGFDFTCRRVGDTEGITFHHPVTRERLEGVDFGVGWSGHESALYAKGCRLKCENPDPYEIPGMGLGLFVMRPDALPEFPEGLRGFGGEELHLHEAVRRNGGKAICLPWLKWVHRFGYTGTAPYTISIEDKFENNLRWEVMLGMDKQKVWGLGIEDCVNHFKQIIPNTYEVICKNVFGENDMACGCDKKKVEPAVTGSIEEMYNSLKDTPSDINEHLELLSSLASQCDTVVEFGVRTGVSTTALLRGVRGKLYSYDVNDSAQARRLKELVSEKFDFTVASSLDVETQQCDMLFVDTLHTAPQIYAELTKHHGRVNRWIAIHDTETFGEYGEGHTNETPTPGLLPGIRRFLKENPLWMVMTVRRNNHGLMVLTCNPNDMPPLPSVAKMGVNAALALMKVASSGLKMASPEAVESRIAHCLGCELRVADSNNGQMRCSHCGCFLLEGPAGAPGRALLSVMECPVGKWSKE